MNTFVEFGQRYAERKLATTPLLPRQKRPYLTDWGNYPLTTADAVREHWRRHPSDNIGIVLGPKSGLVDIEHDTDSARQILERLLSDEDRRTPSYVSTKSTHRLYRLPGNADLLGHDVVAITGKNVAACEGLEVRMGLDGQTQSAAPPSVVDVNGKSTTYRWLPGLAPWEIGVQPFPEIVLEYVLERLSIMDEAKTITSSAKPMLVRLPTGDRVGDVFNAQVSWHDVLAPAGWRERGCSGELTLWVHPQSQSGSHSATTGWVSQAGNDVLCVYSTATPFRSVLVTRATYTKFEAYAVLYHRGDRKAAARDLARKGYKPEPRQSTKTRTYRVVDVSSILRSA